MREMSMYEIARRLVDWGKAEDPYGFNDCYDSDEEALTEILKDFEYRDRLQGDIEYLQAYTIENPYGELADEAGEIIEMIQQWMKENGV